jgi:hypothetical protein
MFNFKSMLVGTCAMAVALTATSAASAPTKSAGTGDDQWVVEEQLWVVFIDEPTLHIRAAREDFMNKDAGAAAAQIRKVAAFLRIDAGRASGAARRGLLTSASELDRLARSVKNGTVKSVRELDRVFARTYHSLAEYQYLMASEAWEKGQPCKAGHALKSAANCIEQGFKCAGHAVDTGTRKTLNAARDLSGKLIEGTGKVGEGVGTVIEDCGKAITRLGQRIGS